eukprot:Gb_08026 [translate_table: standard]
MALSMATDMGMHGIIAGVRPPFSPSQWQELEHQALIFEYMVAGGFGATDSDHGKIVIGGISWDTSEERLKDYFNAYGEVVDVVIMKDRIAGWPRGFGFVVFVDPSVTDRVIQEKHNIDGRTVKHLKSLGFLDPSNGAFQIFRNGMEWQRETQNGNKNGKTVQNGNRGIEQQWGQQDKIERKQNRNDKTK